MQTTVLTEVYALLKTIGAVANEAEFSRDWLGRSECYMRTLRFKGDWCEHRQCRNLCQQAAALWAADA